jgi:hypothetical protein
MTLHALRGYTSCCKVSIGVDRRGGDRTWRWLLPTLA